jgi:hypothetical protein
VFVTSLSTRCRRAWAMLGLMETAPTWANAQATLNRLAASQSPDQAARTKALSQSFALAQRRVEPELMRNR